MRVPWGWSSALKASSGAGPRGEAAGVPPYLVWVLTFLTPFLMFWIFLVGDLLAELWFLREMGRGG